MQENMQQQTGNGAQTPPPNSSKTKAPGKVGDYIDFEEVKD